MPTSVDSRGWAGRSQGWRYLAQRLYGDGTPGPFLHNELPLHDVAINDVLSGPPQLTATISPVFKSLKASDGAPLLGEWSTVIHAEADGVIRASCVLVGSDFRGEAWSLDCSGFTTVMKGMQYPDTVTFSETDPLEIVRHIWSRVQADPDTNMGMSVDPYTSTPIRVGALPAATPVVTDTSSSSTTSVATAAAATTDKPYELNWWSTYDLGGEIDKLAQSTPFDYHERHEWNTDHTNVLHFLDFGYPSLGQRRPNLRFVLGENVQQLPDPTRDGQGFANHVVVLGAGEGSVMVKGEARVRDGRIRRMAVIDDKSITDSGDAVTAARLELARRQQLLQVTDFVVRNHPMAPIGSFNVGDEIRLQASTDWVDLDMWCRVVSIGINPEKPDMMSVSVLRSDWVS